MNDLQVGTIDCKLTLSFLERYSYAVLLIEKKDEEGQAHVLSAALEVHKPFY